MFSSLEILAIIAIVIVQFVIAFRVYKQIQSLKNFLPQGRSSLSLEEYEVPVEKISDLEPRDIVGHIIYRPSTLGDENKTVSEHYRTVYSVKDGDIRIDSEGNRISEEDVQSFI